MFWISSLTQIITILSISRIYEETWALRDVRIKMPHAIRRGQQRVLLKCLYDIEDDILYAVKWYKGRREFYRYTPSEEPPMKVFQFSGIRVDRSASNETHLMLDTVTMATAGKYSCEVSADAPSFHTLIAAAELQVVELPHHPPIITGIRQRYHIGDILRGNCTTRHSKPSANLTWTVNDDEVQPSYVRHLKVHKENRSEIQATTISIQFIINNEHFDSHGRLKLRCIAQIGDIYYKTIEKIIHQADYHHYQHHHHYSNNHNHFNHYNDNDDNDNNNNDYNNNKIDMLKMTNGLERAEYGPYTYQGQQLSSQKTSNFITQVQELSAWSTCNNFHSNCFFFTNIFLFDLVFIFSI